jgi:hypothetical protein
VADDDLAYRLRAPYRALYLAAKRAAAETDAAAAEGRPAEERSVGSDHIELRDQVAELLADVDMSEEDRQKVLASLSCTCCGSSGLSLAFEIKPAEKTKF